MNKRLKIVGRFLIAGILSFLTALLTVLLVPIWGIIWVISGWWFPKEVFIQIEKLFPEYVES